MRPLARLAARVAAIASLGSTCTASGQTASPVAGAPATPPLSAQGACPEQAAIWSELATLVPLDRFAARLDEVSRTGPAIEIADLGASYRVTAAGRGRVYRDDARACAERARVAALFIALAIDPADTAARAPAPAAPPPPAAPAPAAAPPPARKAAPPLQPSLVDVDVGAGMDVGLGSGATVWAPAGLVGAALGRGRLAALLQIAVDLPANGSAGTARLRQWRAPVILGVRGRLIRARAAPFAELGLAAGPIVARGRDIVTPSTAVSLELGVAAALGIRLGGRAGAFLVARGEVVPERPEVFALPAGLAGHTPRFWVGAAAGVSLGMR